MADILSQEEIDALLEIVDEDGNIECFAPRRNDYSNKSLYDIKRPNTLSRDNIRTIRGIHDKFARMLTKELSNLFELEVEVTMHSACEMTYGEYLMSLPSPTCFNVISLLPIPGNHVLEMNPSITFSMIDRLLGGTGEGYETSRDFTDIELNLLDPLLRVTCQNLKEAWTPIIDCYPTIEGKESSPNVIQVVPMNNSVVQVVMEICIGQSYGMMNLMYSVPDIERLFEKTKRCDLDFCVTEVQQTFSKPLSEVKKLKEKDIIYL